MKRSTKYEPIKEYLMKHNSTVVQLTYKEIEEIIDDLLPSSAYNYSEWWANGEHIQAESWIDAGWEVEEVKLEEYIVFGKKRIVASIEIEEEIKDEDLIDIDTNANTEKLDKRKKNGPSIKYIYFGLAVIVLGMFFVAVKDVSRSALEITYIKSVGGKTMEEAYYAEMGNIYLAFANVIGAVGIFLSSVLVWLGLKR